MNPFTRRHVELDNCSCPIAEHSRATALIELSCACKRTECVSCNAVYFDAVRLNMFGFTLNSVDDNASL